MQTYSNSSITLFLATIIFSFCLCFFSCSREINTDEWDYWDKYQYNQIMVSIITENENFIAEADNNVQLFINEQGSKILEIVLSHNYTNPINDRYDVADKFFEKYDSKILGSQYRINSITLFTICEKYIRYTNNFKEYFKKNPG